MWLVEATFTNHPICDSIRSSAAANCVSSSKKAIFENRESHQSVARLARANFGLDRFGLVTWKGRTPMLRMLQVPELKRAMGFDNGYTLPYGSRRDRIKLLGNGVCPPVL